MDAYIKKIYDMLYSPILSPYNLLENAKLDNYSYVKYYKNENGLMAEMECEIPDEGRITFLYQFDKNDYLQKIYQKDDRENRVVFDRECAVQDAERDYYRQKKVLEEVS